MSKGSEELENQRTATSRTQSDGTGTIRRKAGAPGEDYLTGSREGLSDRDIGRKVGIHYNVVSKWRRRFSQRGVGTLQDEPRSCSGDFARDHRPSSSGPARHGRWSCRLMARELGVSKTTVQRMWSHNQIKTYLNLRRTFKLSTDPVREGCTYLQQIRVKLRADRRELKTCGSASNSSQAWAYSSLKRAGTSPAGESRDSRRVIGPKSLSRPTPPSRGRLISSVRRYIPWGIGLPSRSRIHLPPDSSPDLCLVRAVAYRKFAQRQSD